MPLTILGDWGSSLTMLGRHGAHSLDRTGALCIFSAALIPTELSRRGRCFVAAASCIGGGLGVAVRTEKAKVELTTIQVVAVHVLDLQGKWFPLPLRPLSAVRATKWHSGHDQCPAQLHGRGSPRPTREHDQYLFWPLSPIATSDHPPSTEVRGI